MAEWEYDKAWQAVLEREGDKLLGVIACHVRPKHGALMAMSPRMEAWLRAFLEFDCDCPRCREAASILRGVDEARKAVES